MENKWNSSIDDWSEKFKWFLVDEGQIHYSFRSKLEARMFREEFFLSYMLLTNLKHINEIMIDPSEYRSWMNKEQKCVYKDKESLLK